MVNGARPLHLLIPIQRRCDIICAHGSARKGYLGAAWGLGGGNSIGAPPLVVHGTREQQERLLVPILRGDKRICLGITEPSGGSDVAGIKTTAVRTEEGYRVTGVKKVSLPSMFRAPSDVVYFSGSPTE